MVIEQSNMEAKRFTDCSPQGRRQVLRTGRCKIVPSSASLSLSSYSFSSVVVAEAGGGLRTPDPLASAAPGYTAMRCRFV